METLVIREMSFGDLFPLPKPPPPFLSLTKKWGGLSTGEYLGIKRQAIRNAIKRESLVKGLYHVSEKSREFIHISTDYNNKIKLL